MPKCPKCGTPWQDRAYTDEFGVADPGPAPDCDCEEKELEDEPS